MMVAVLVITIAGEFLLPWRMMYVLPSSDNYSLLTHFLVRFTTIAPSDGHAAALRHRQLPRCVKKGGYCAPYPDTCCGSTVCEGVGFVCCIPEEERGCDVDDDCCPLAGDGVTPLACLDSLCVGSDIGEVDEERTVCMNFFGFKCCLEAIIPQTRVHSHSNTAYAIENVSVAFTEKGVM